MFKPDRPADDTLRSRLPGDVFLLWLGVGLGVLYWLIAAGIDAFVSPEGDFVSELFSPHAFRSWERLLACALLVGYACVVFMMRRSRRSAEAPLRGSLEFTTKVVNAVSDGLFVKDADHRRVFVNDAYCALLDQSREQLLGKSDQDLHPPELAAQFAAQDDVILSGAGEQIREETRIDLGGQQHVLSIKKALYIDGSGRRFVVGISRDITDSRKAQEEIELKAQLLDTASDAILLLDQTGAFIYFNDALSRMTGFSRDELNLRGLHGIEPPEFAERIAGNIARLFASGSAIFESAYLRKDGSVLPVEVHARVTRVGGRDVVLSLVRDFSERKLMEKRLLRAQAEWEETFNIITEAITVHDADFNIVRSNKAAESILNLSYITLRRQKCYESFHGASSPPGNCASCQVLKTGIASTVEVYEPHLGKHLEIRALPRRGPEGNLIGVVHIVRDITARKEAEERQRHLQVQLLQAQKMESIGRFAGGIAHDFNNILSSILGYSELGLFKSERASAPWKMFDVINDSGQKAAGLIRQLLAFSRRQLLEVRPVNLHTLIGDLAGMLRRMIREDVILELDLAAAHHTINADPQQIGQVLMNLVVNARDAMPEGGRLTIGTADLDVGADAAGPHGKLEPGQHVAITVRDTGTGMSREVLERVFEPFFTTKQVGEGTGLGLATVYGIVSQHKGTITVASEPGRGSTFTITLAASGEDVQEAPAPAVSSLPSGTETVLVVDDEPNIRTMISAVLVSLGYRVFEASGGAEALRLAAGITGDLDVLLTDVIMPGMNGRELAEALLAERPRLVVVFISGYTDDIIAPHGVLGEGTHFLPKPVTPSSVATALRAILDQRS